MGIHHYHIFHIFCHLLDEFDLVFDCEFDSGKLGPYEMALGMDSVCGYKTPGLKW